jgi:hypothetical protein
MAGSLNVADVGDARYGHMRNSSCGSDALMMSGGSERPLPSSIESGEGGRSPLPFSGSDRDSSSGSGSGSDRR